MSLIPSYFYLFTATMTKIKGVLRNCSFRPLLPVGCSRTCGYDYGYTLIDRKEPTNYTEFLCICKENLCSNITCGTTSTFTLERITCLLFTTVTSLCLLN